jgi:phenylalanyl-tRNA synthetase beta chain
MKFSYLLIKNLVPKLKSKSQLVEALNLHAFETEDGGGNVFEVDIPPNRYSDAASHWGIAREISAILNFKFQYKEVQPPKIHRQSRKIEPLKIIVEDKNLCPRYIAQYFENIRIKQSPAWLQKILKDCGLRPINNVVDVMNYAMLETGQPLHAFDADKLEGKTIIVRRAKNGESIISIDDINYKLASDILVIADAKKPQAIAGIKGGKGAEITKGTNRIIVESANFDSVSIYNISKAIKLTTDASSRFSHGLSPALPEIGISRAAQLLTDLCGAKPAETFDSLSKPLPRRVLKFDLMKFNRFIGMNLSLRGAENYLKRLGFKKITSNGVNSDKWEIPILRDDIERFEDLAEEVIRLYGYDRLRPIAPHVAVQPSEFDDFIIFKDKIRKILVGFGLDEVYNYSFVSDGEVEILNPVAEDKKFLRPSLLPGLIRNIDDNFRFFERVGVFELGKVFNISEIGGNIRENLRLGIALAAKKDETFFELKGIIDELLKELGLVDFFMRDITVASSFLYDGLQVESDHTVVGYLGRRQNGVSLAEFGAEELLTLVEGELSFEPLSKFPSVMRDISILVDADVRIGEIVRIIQQLNPDLIEDVDLIDEYIDEKWQNLQSLTFRIVFQAKDRTLTSVEVDDEMEKITKILQQKFNARIR